MYLYLDSCENKIDVYGNQPKLDMMYWKRVHLGLIKIWLGYELYTIINSKTKEIIKGKNLSTIEIKWSWK